MEQPRQIMVQAASKDEIRMVYGFARMAARGDNVTLQVIEKCAAYQEALWLLEAQAKRQAEEVQAPAALPS